jgi:hypothetical protein
MALLYEAGDSWVPLDRLIAVGPDTLSGTQANRMALVQVGYIRKKFGSHAILCRPELGYTLGAPGVIVCRRADGTLLTNERSVLTSPPTTSLRQ